MIVMLYRLLEKLLELLSNSTKILVEVKLNSLRLTAQTKRFDAIDASLLQLQTSLIKLEGDHDEMATALQAVTVKLDKLLASLSPPEAEKLTFICVMEGETFLGDNMIIKAGQFFSANLKATDRYGNAAVLDPENPPVFVSSNPEVATVTTAADGLSAVVQSTGKMGTAQISVTADAVIGPEEKLIVGTLELEVLSGDAVVVSLEPGPVSDPVEPVV
jgi:ribosome-associated translation inhibitor RaiA